MKILISTQIIEDAGLNQDEKSVLHYLCSNPLFVLPKEEKMAVSAGRNGRREIFLTVMEKFFEVLEAQRAKR